MDIFLDKNSISLFSFIIPPLDVFIIVTSFFNTLISFNTAVREIPEIEQCHMIAGKFDYLLKVRTKNIIDYRHTLGEKISSLPCVSNTSTHVVMEAIKD